MKFLRKKSAILFVTILLMLALDSTQARSQQGKTLSSRIDFIFAGPRDVIDSGQVAVNTSRVVMKEIIHGVHASDHYGIYTEFLVGSP